MGNIVIGTLGGGPAMTYYNTSKVSFQSCSDNPCSSTTPVFLTLNNGGFADATEYQQSKKDYLNALYLHSLLIDNGNTNRLKQQIDYNWSTDALELRNQLLRYSPNLSTEVLLHAAQKGILPPALLFEVCRANLRAVKSPLVLEKLQTEIPNVLPPYMIEMLINAEEPSSDRKILENELAGSAAELSNSYNALVRFLKADSTADRYDILFLLNDIPLIEAKLQLMEEYLIQNDKVGATAALNSFLHMAEGVLPNATARQIQEFSEFRISKAEPGKLRFSTDDISYLQSVAADSGHAYFVYANNILKVNGRSNYLRDPLNPTDKGIETPKQLGGLSNATPNLKLYPSPAKDFITVEFKSPVVGMELSAEVMDNNGRILSTTTIEQTTNQASIANINIYTLPSGTYTVAIKQGGKLVESKSFVKAN